MKDLLFIHYPTTVWASYRAVSDGAKSMGEFIGSFKGLYVMCLAATMYLMLPMFDGSTLIFREILIPVLGQQELLYLRDARALAAQFVQKLPAHRQESARREAAKAFVGENATE